MPKFYKLKDIDLWFLLSILGLCIVGALTVFSTTFSRTEGTSPLFWNHLIFYGIGALLFSFISLINPKRIKNLLIIGLTIIGTLGSLVLVLLAGTEVYGATRWIDLGFFSFQPSEFAKVAIILVAAFCFGVYKIKHTEKLFDIYNTQIVKYFDIKRILKSDWLHKTVIAFLFYTTTILLVIKQRSLGNSILISLIFFTVLLFRLKITIENLLLAIPLILGIIISLIDAGNINSLYGLDTNFNFIGLIVAIGILIFLSNKLKLNKILLFVFLIIGLLIPLVLSFAYNSILEPYQRERITTFLMPSSEASLDEDFNRQMSVMAVGSGRVFGKGFLNGNIVNSGLLPFAFTDFAFAGFAEQFGFAGSLLIILLYLILIIRMFLIYKNADTDFNKLICIGTIALIFFNFAQHVAMNLGITPITGVPLPLISYGGSSIVSVFLALGLVNSVNLHSKDSDVVVENLHKDYGFYK